MGGYSGMCLVLLVLSSAVFRGEGRGYGQPSSCGKSLECAPYDVIHSRKEFEIREYTKAKWMATKPINSDSYISASYSGFRYLFSYIKGNNAENAKIEMTAPVLVDVGPSMGAFRDFVVYFYLPSKYQTKPPASAKVHPVMLPRKKYAAVRRFGGFANDAKVASEAAKLSKSLKGTPWASVASGGRKAYTVAGYDGPSKTTGRVNEIIFWFQY